MKAAELTLLPCTRVCEGSLILLFCTQPLPAFGGADPVSMTLHCRCRSDPPFRWLPPGKAVVLTLRHSFSLPPPRHPGTPSTRCLTRGRATAPTCTAQLTRSWGSRCARHAPGSLLPLPLPPQSSSRPSLPCCSWACLGGCFPAGLPPLPAPPACLTYLPHPPPA